MTAEELARLFHDLYESLAPSFDYKTRGAAVPWDEMPENSRALVVAMCAGILEAMKRDQKDDLWDGILDCPVEKLYDEGEKGRSLESKERVFLSVAVKVGEVVTAKNRQYGDAFGKAPQFLEALFPEGIPVNAYPQLLTIVRFWDKLKRMATTKLRQSRGEIDVDEAGEDPWLDAMGYCLLEATRKFLPDG